MTTIVVLALAVALVSLLLFPWVGIAMLPVVALAGLVAVAWLFVVLTRGPRRLPERHLPREE